MSMLKSWKFSGVAAGLIALAGTVGSAVAATDAKPQGDAAGVPGMSAEDMQKFAAAATPGKMHEKLAEGLGTWHGEATMWMAPDAEPISCETTSLASSLLDGRFVKLDMSGEMPGMGAWHGVGIFGYDNVAKKFQAVWISDHGTGMMVGNGTMSEDGKTLTWDYTGSCPIANGPIAVRDVETITGPDSKTIESFGADPKTGEEFKMMSIELTRE